MTFFYKSGLITKTKSHVSQTLSTFFKSWWAKQTWFGEVIAINVTYKNHYFYYSTTFFPAYCIIHQNRISVII